MKVSDYIVEFLIQHNITDVFGYPGGMVTHLMDSLKKYEDKINVHINYHEQASSFCACGYAQVKNIPGVAFATSGPGATNLLTGIANAYFDSIPAIFITGQVNTYESKGRMRVRQKGFQETDIVSIANPITKYAKYIDNVEDIKYELEKAYQISMHGRKGPVLLDIPMNIFRSDVNISNLEEYKKNSVPKINKENLEIILEKLLKAKKPLIIAGAGIDMNGMNTNFKKLVNKLGIPVVTSMIAVDLQNSDSKYNFGFIGAYGHRYANFLIEKSDLILTLGSRLDCRQTGANKNLFAKNAEIIRVDIDENELDNKINENEIQIIADIKELINKMLQDNRFDLSQRYQKWLIHCTDIKNKLNKIDNEEGNKIVSKLSEIIKENTIITTDVGQNQVWVSQSFIVKNGQRIIYSGGHGSMGYSLPAAIGAYYAKKSSVICFCGDGGIQMNIQELQFIIREKIPIKIIVLNNKSLGMIRHFQEMYFEKCYTQTMENTGYSVPDFCKIADAYGINNIKVYDIEKQVNKISEMINSDQPALIQIEMSNYTYIYPKLAVNMPIYNQEPKLDESIINEILKDEISE